MKSVNMRNSSIELLKIFAMLLIAFSHSTPRPNALFGG